jgi:uncharacterized protein YndB with AHSA1/START domain
MTEATDTGTSVVRSTIVRAPIERAFKVFTEDMGSWWDADHHLVDGFERMEVELRVGGRITDFGKDGQTCAWSRVLAYEPPHRFVFSWDISLQWQVETDPAKASEVEVLFEPDGDGATKVTLTHRHLDRHGDGWEQMRAAVGSPNGWNLTTYADVAAAAAA